MYALTGRQAWPANGLTDLLGYNWYPSYIHQIDLWVFVILNPSYNLIGGVMTGWRGPRGILKAKVLLYSYFLSSLIPTTFRHKSQWLKYSWLVCCITKPMASNWSNSALGGSGFIAAHIIDILLQHGYVQDPPYSSSYDWLQTVNNCALALILSWPFDRTRRASRFSRLTPMHQRRNFLMWLFKMWPRMAHLMRSVSNCFHGICKTNWDATGRQV